MENFFRDFQDAVASNNGYQLSDTLLPSPLSEDLDRLRRFYDSTTAANVKKDIQYCILYDKSSQVRLSRDEGNAWVDVYAAYWSAVGEILKADDDQRQNLPVKWSSVYDAWKELANAIIRGYSADRFEAWTIPCLYVIGKYLRVFAINTDKSGFRRGDTIGFQDDFNPDAGKNEKLEDAARVLNRMFTLCLSDRAPLEESRKWGTYNIINLLFKTYFKLNSVSLSKNIIRALQATRGDMPDITSFPKSHQVTFKYYMGVIQFLEENYEQAETYLTEAWELCHKSAKRNKELILTYLIPCHLITTHTLPSQALLAPYPRLQKLFSPLAKCIKKGDLAGFDKALVAGEEEFVRRRIYLTLERGRDIALRNLLRKVFIAGGFEEVKDGALPTSPQRRTRIPVAEFAAAISLGSRERIDNDEVECLLANMIYKNLMKGYIARNASFVVLNKKGAAFPGTGV